MSKASDGTPISTKLVAQIAEWEGEATFDTVRVFKRGKDTFVIELMDEDGNFVELSLPSAGLKKLISWRMLMSL